MSHNHSPLFEKWQYVMKDLESPQLFIDFTFLWTLSAAVGRKIFLSPRTEGGMIPLYPNQFIVFVAPPGIGKTICASLSGDLILKTYYKLSQFEKDNKGAPKKILDIPFAADATSFESLIEQLKKATRATRDKEGKVVAHSSLTVLLSNELSTMFRKNIEGLTAFFNQTYDSRSFSYETRNSGSFWIDHVCVNMLGCTTYDNMRKLYKMEILEGGFASRALFICAERGDKRQLTVELKMNDEQRQCLEDIKEHVKLLKDIAGKAFLTEEAYDYLKHWYENDHQKDLNTSNILIQDYYARKKEHICKLAMAIEFSKEEIFTKYPFEITKASIESAVVLLRQAEFKMPLALADGVENPIHSAAQELLKILSEGPKRNIEVQIRLNARANKAQRDEAINYLKETEQIETLIDKKNQTLFYRLKAPKNVISHDSQAAVGDND